MTTEVELERLVVRLIGDAHAYRQMLKDAEEETKSFASSITQTLVQAAGALGGAAFLKGTFASFSEGEAVTLKLKAALEGNQREVESTLADYEAFALQMQRSTTFSDEHIKSLLKTAETYGLTGEQAKKATQDAMALAAATDSEATSMMRLIAAVTRGNKEDLEHLEHYKRLIPQLRMAHSQEEQLEVIQRLIATGTGVLAAQIGTTSGKIKQMAEEWDNLKEQLGSVVAEAITPTVGGIKDIVVWFQNTDPAIRTVIVGFTGVTAAIVSFNVALTTMRALGISGMAVGWATGIGMVATGVMAATVAVVKGTEEWKKYIEELEKIRKFGQLGAKGIAEQGAKIVEEAAGKNPKERIKFLEEEIKKARGLEQLFQEQTGKVEGMLLEHRAQRAIGRRVAGAFGMDKRDTTLEEGFKAQEALLKAQQEQVRKLRDEHTQLSRQGDPEKRLKQLQEELKAAAQHVAINDQLKRAAEAQGDERAGIEFGLRAGKNRAEVEKLGKEVEKLKAVLEGKLFDKAKEDMDKFTDGLKLQIDTYGMAESQAKLYALQIKHNLSPAQMEAAQALIDVVEAFKIFDQVEEAELEAKKKLEEATTSYVKELEREVDVLRLGAEAAKLKQLAEEGVEEAILGHIAGMQEEKKFLEENKRLREEADRMLERAMDADPATKYENELDRLDKMLKRQIISEDEFMVMLGLINDEFHNTEEAAKKAGHEVQKFDAALSGSAEAGKRIGDFYSKLAEQYAKVGTVAKKRGRFGGELEFIGGEGLEAQVDKEEPGIKLRPGVVFEEGKFFANKREVPVFGERDIAAGAGIGGAIAQLVPKAEIWDQIGVNQAIMVDEEKKQVAVLEDILKAIKDGGGQQIVFEAAEFD